MNLKVKRGKWWKPFVFTFHYIYHWINFIAMVICLLFHLVHPTLLTLNWTFIFFVVNRPHLKINEDDSIWWTLSFFSVELSLIFFRLFAVFYWNFYSILSMVVCCYCTKINQWFTPQVYSMTTVGKWKINNNAIGNLRLRLSKHHKKCQYNFFNYEPHEEKYFVYNFNFIRNEKFDFFLLLFLRLTPSSSTKDVNMIFALTTWAIFFHQRKMLEIFKRNWKSFKSMKMFDTFFL